MVMSLHTSTYPFPPLDLLWLPPPSPPPLLFSCVPRRRPQGQPLPPWPGSGAEDRLTQGWGHLGKHSDWWFQMVGACSQYPAWLNLFRELERNSKPGLSPLLGGHLSAILRIGTCQSRWLPDWEQKGCWVIWAACGLARGPALAAVMLWTTLGTD